MRFPRILTALVATGTAATVLGLSAAPVAADQVRGQEWWLRSLGVSGIWPASRGAGVTVAVLSDGIVRSHPDLAGAVTTAPAIKGAPVAAGQFFGEQGTSIASLIAGRGHGPGGASGVIGVAPKAQILSVPVTLPSDDPQLGQAAVATAIPAAIAAGIRYAVHQGAGVIDLPIDPGQPGSNGRAGAPAATGGSPAVRQAINYALDHNVVVVAPAGDSGATTNAVNYPAAYPGVIAVGAFDSTFSKAPWTSHRAYVTLTGPGSGVEAATAAGGYQTMNSTAAASAVVAGIVALIRSRYPTLSVADVRNALTTTTSFHRPGGTADGSGFGAVNAAKAFLLASVLATPAKDRAGAGAQPAVTPGPAPAGVGAQSLRAQIVRAGEISGAVLVLLLLLVTWYAILRRRRRSSSSVPASLTAQWTAGHTQSRYPHAPITDADRMLELFAVPLAAPEPTPGRPEKSGAPARAAGPVSGLLDSRDLFATTPRSREPDFESRPPRPQPVAMRPPVSGTPPWEPAPQPAGELPWSDEPVPQTVAGEIVASGFPAGQAIDPRVDVPAPPPADWPRRPGPEGQPTQGGRPSWDDRPQATPPAARRRPQRGASAHGAGAAARNGSWAEKFGRSQRAAPAASSGGRAGRAAGDTADIASQHPSGLPIRQPRAAPTEPLSPSGSLWERPQEASSLWEKSAQTPDNDWDEATDAAGRPIYTWDPARTER